MSAPPKAIVPLTRQSGWMGIITSNLMGKDPRLGQEYTCGSMFTHPRVDEVYGLNIKASELLHAQSP